MIWNFHSQSSECFFYRLDFLTKIHIHNGERRIFQNEIQLSSELVLSSIIWNVSNRRFLRYVLTHWKSEKFIGFVGFFVDRIGAKIVLNFPYHSSINRSQLKYFENSHIYNISNKFQRYQGENAYLESFVNHFPLNPTT